MKVHAGDQIELQRLAEHVAIEVAKLPDVIHGGELAVICEQTVAVMRELEGLRLALAPKALEALVGIRKGPLQEVVAMLGEVLGEKTS
jgi:hypothetical protein